MKFTSEFALQNKFGFAFDAHLQVTLGNNHLLANDVKNERAYVCVRHSNIDVTLSNDMSGRGTFTWVGHCVLTKVTLGNDRELELTLQLVSSSVPPPDALFTSSALPATVEFIEKPEEFRYKNTFFSM